MNMGEIKKEFGKDLDGNEMLCQRDLSLVRKEVDRSLKEGMEGGGFILSIAGSAHEGVENRGSHGDVPICPDRRSLPIRVVGSSIADQRIQVGRLQAQRVLNLRSLLERQKMISKHIEGNVGLVHKTLNITPKTPENSRINSQEISVH